MSKKKRRKNPRKGRMPPALKKYWASRRRKSNPRKRRRNPIAYRLYAQRPGGKVLKYTGGIKFAATGKPMDFSSKHAALRQGRALRLEFPKVLKPYRMWAA
jgi:hypothetical protein